jgi:hypothetical protein
LSLRILYPVRAGTSDFFRTAGRNSLKFSLKRAASASYFRQGVAAALEVEDAFIRPALLVIADQTT